MKYLGLHPAWTPEASPLFPLLTLWTTVRGSVVSPFAEPVIWGRRYSGVWILRIFRAHMLICCRIFPRQILSDPPVADCVGNV